MPWSRKRSRLSRRCRVSISTRKRRTCCATSRPTRRRGRCCRSPPASSSRYSISASSLAAPEKERAMRISSSMIYDLGVATLQRNQAEQVNLQQHISSGRRVLTPSDDPVAAASALEVTQAKGLNDQYNTNAGVAKDKLSLEESALADATNVLQNVKTLAVYAGNGSLTSADKQSIAAELESNYQELLAV